jgi:hypothetical protein
MKFLIAVLLSTALFSDNSIHKESSSKVNDSYFYGSFNLGPAPLPLPGFGLGYRVQNDHFGLDTHVQLTSVVVVNFLKVQSQALFYFKPKLESQFYMGLGGSYSKLFHSFEDCSLTSPEITFGKCYLNENDSRRHFELQISWPTFFHDEKTHIAYFPLCVFSYGIGF